MKKPAFIVMTNAIRPYHKHNISILSLPPGGKYHFRYRRPYVSTDIPEDIAGLPGLLVLRNKQTGELLPVRWCTGVRKEDFGEYIFFDFQFDAIFDVTSLSEGDAWKKYRPALEEMLPAGMKNLPDTDFTPLVFPVSAESLSALGGNPSKPPSVTASTDHVQRWLGMVASVGKLEAYRDEHFYTVSRVYEDNSGASAERDYHKLSAKRNGYKLIGNRVYFVDVIQITVPLKGGKGPIEELKLSFPKGHIQGLRTSWIIDGPYDRARFFFYVLPQEASATPSLIILSKQLPMPRENPSTSTSDAGLAAEGLPVPVGGPEPGPPVPPTLLDLDIAWGARKQIGRRVLPLVAFVTGVVMFFGADRIATHWPLAGMAKGPDYLRYAAIFALAFAFNSLSSFVGSLKPTTKSQG